MSDNDNQVTLWDKQWERQKKQLAPADILNTKFTKEAYRCLKNFVHKDARLILEAGCGTGRLCCLVARDLSESCVLGIDKSKGSLEIAQSIKNYLSISNVSFNEGDLFKIDYADNYFDLVFNDGVIEHFQAEKSPNYKDALKEMIRVTKPKGRIIVSVPNWYNFPHTIYKWILKIARKNFEYGYEKSFSRKELIHLFKEHNLTKIEVMGYDPSHGFYRLGKYSRIFMFLGKITEILTNKFTANIFGYMIMIKGEKL